MSKKMNDLASLLPEGLSESAITEVAELVSSVIEEQVGAKVKELEAKVHGFLRFKIDEVKDHALSELQLENETFKNAQMFESIKTLMTLELNQKDEDSAVSEVVKDNNELVEEVSVLTDELRKALVESTTLENQVKVLSDKINSIGEEKESLLEQVSALEESQEKPFKSSEKAIMVSEVSEKNEKTHVPNEFLTEEVMKFMPFNN